jgi:hypothetical protein
MTTNAAEDGFYYGIAHTPTAFDEFLNDPEADPANDVLINPSDLVKKESTDSPAFNLQQEHRNSSSSSSDESLQHHRNNSQASAASSAFMNWGTGVNGISMPTQQMFGDSPMGGLDNDYEASNRQMASDFDFDTAASTPSGFDPQLSYAPSGKPMKARFAQSKGASPKVANTAQSGFYIANSREASPLNAMLAGSAGHSPWNKPSPSAGLENEFNTITMNGDSPSNPAFSPNMQFNSNFNFEIDSSATPSSFGMDVSSPPSTLPSLADGAPRLTVHPTSLKSRVETQIPIILTLSHLPEGAKKIKLPTHTVSKPKFLIKGEHESDPEVLELHTSLVCTSAMQDKVKLNRALARSRGEDLPPFSKPSPASSTTSSSSKDDEDKPLNGGEVKICTGCIQRERKRASRKKQKKPEEEEAFQRDEERRVVVFNTSQIKEWVDVHKEAAEGTAKPPPRASSAPPGAMQVELPMRIACYCRHQNEKLGFQVIFTVKDHVGRVIAQTLTNPIMITDDHKTHNQPATVQPVAAPLPNAPAVPGAGVFQTAGADNKPAPAVMQPKMFKQSFSTNDLNGLQNSFNPNFGMGSSNNPFAISSAVSSTTSATLTPRNLSRPASPNGPMGPTTKKRKQSGSGKLPTGLTMTRLDTAPIPPGTSTMPSTAASSPYPTPMTSYMPPMTAMYPNNQMRTSPPTPNGNEPGFSAANRSFSLENMPRQVMISAPPSRQPSRPGSPVSGRNSFGAADHTLTQGVNNQLMNQVSRRAPPLIHKLVPAEGSVTGGTEVTLLGNGFYQGLEVMFGDTEATTTTFWGEKCLNCIAPPALQPGTVAVVFKHEHRNYMPQATQPRTILFTYIDDRELEMFRLALRTIGKQMSLPTDDPYSAAQQLLQSSQQQSMWGAPNGGYSMGHQRSSGLTGAPMDKGELENVMVQLLEYMDLRAPTALSRLDLRRPSGLTLLHLASSLGLPRFAAGLLARGANPHLVDNNGHTAMHHAAMYGHTQIIHRLRLSGASHRVRSVKGFSPADLATSLQAYQAVTVPSLHYRSRSVGGTPMRLHSRQQSSSSLHSFWENDSDTNVSESSDDGREDSAASLELVRTASRSLPSSRRGSAQHARHALQPLTSPDSVQPEPNETFMAAWRDQLQAHIQKYNEATQALQSMMPSFPALNGHLQALQQEYQANPMVRRVSQLFPQRPSNSRSNSTARRNDGWWDALTGNRSPSPTQQPPAYESLFPADGPSAGDISLKKLSTEQAAADAIADQHFEAQSSSQVHSRTEEYSEDMLVRRDIKRIELSKDRKLFFIWVRVMKCWIYCIDILTISQIPILAIVLGLMLKSSGIFELIGSMRGDNLSQERVVEVM